jgi:hypothetical protein
VLEGNINDRIKDVALKAKPVYASFECLTRLDITSVRLGSALLTAKRPAKPSRTNVSPRKDMLCDNHAAVYSQIG